MSNKELMATAQEIAHLRHNENLWANKQIGAAIKHAVAWQRKYNNLWFFTLLGVVVFGVIMAVFNG